MRWWGVVALLVLAGCDAGPSAVMHDGEGTSPARDPAPVRRAKAGDVEEASMPIVDAAESKEAKSYAPVKVPDGNAVITETRYGDWPLWSKNRKHSAGDNAHYQFQKHGAEFGAKSYQNYLAIVHGFVHAPPKGTQTLKRKNGDTLYYDPKQNIFAVATKAGAPRTFFRPDGGLVYWDQQKQIEAARTTKDTADD